MSVRISDVPGIAEAVGSLWLAGKEDKKGLQQPSIDGRILGYNVSIQGVPLTDAWTKFVWDKLGILYIAVRVATAALVGGRS